MLTSETEPEALVADVGPNATFKEADWPGWIVTGAVRPEALKPVPVTVICEIVRLALPVLEMLIGCELICPTVTEPKLTVEGEAVIAGCAPVPLKATVALAVELPRLAAIETVPVALPVAVGANLAVKLVLDPAASE